MMPRIDARKRMNAAQAVALGSGTMKRPDAAQAWRGLERAAGAHVGRLATREDLSVLSAIGISVTEVQQGG